jgi:uncharacterized protein (TIGR02246 family)
VCQRSKLPDLGDTNDWSNSAAISLPSRNPIPIPRNLNSPIVTVSDLRRNLETLFSQRLKSVFASSVELASLITGISIAQIVGSMTKHIVCDRLKGLRCIAFILVSVFLFVAVSAKADKIKPESASNSDDRKLVSKVVDNLISAWNKNDAEAMAKLFLPDGVLITPTGSVIRRRSEIRKRVSGERQGKLKDTMVTHAVNKVSLLNDGTALVEGTYQLKGMKILGVETSPQGSFIVRHKKQQGRWMISKAEILKKKEE